MNQPTTHTEQLVFLKKIEGQIRGIQKMIEEKRYCVDIITQIHSVIGALSRVENGIFKKHISSCVANTFKSRSRTERQEKIDELLGLIAKFRNIL